MRLSKTDISSHNPPPCVAPLEHSDEYYDENYDYEEKMREDTPIKQLEDVLKFVMMLISTSTIFLPCLMNLPMHSRLWS